MKVLRDEQSCINVVILSIVFFCHTCAAGAQRGCYKHVALELLTHDAKRCLLETLGVSDLSGGNGNRHGFHAI